MLVVTVVALAAPAAAGRPGCQAFGALVADAAQRDPLEISNPGNLHIHHIVTGIAPGSVDEAVDFFKGQAIPACPLP